MLYFTLYAKIETKCEGRKRMSEIKLTNEIYFALAKCKDAKSAMAMLKSKGYDVTEEKAESLWSAIQNEILTDEELDKLTGGTTSGTNAVEHVQNYTFPFTGNTASQGGAL